MGILANENAISTGGYQIANSLRFQSANSNYMTRTPASNGNLTTLTFSFWVKRGKLNYAEAVLYNADTSNSSTDYFAFGAGGGGAGDSLICYLNGGAGGSFVTSQVFRDPSAWYHIVIAFDTTQATAANRVKFYVNGSQITSFSTANYPTQNYNFVKFNRSAYTQVIGAVNSTTSLFDGYFAEWNFIDGQALTPSSFGATNALTGQWCAAKYTGTYGTNGFYLPFSNGTSTTTLGADSSGNGNNWTLTNFTRSAGVSDCWMYDVPSGNGYGPATQPSSNYCVINPLNKSSIQTVSNANLNIASSGTTGCTLSTVATTSGKYYWEGTLQALSSNAGFCDFGFTLATFSTGSSLETTSGAWCVNDTGAKTDNGTQTNSWAGSNFAVNDVLMCAIDLDAGKAWFGKNGTWYASGSPSTGTNPACSSGIAGSNITPTIGSSAGTSRSFTWTMNYGNRSFAYTPPSGFKALCTANLPAATIVKGNQYMDATLYSGNLVGQAITNAASFQPDLVWIKSRSAATDNKLTDSVRGATKALISNTTGAETTDVTGVVSFNSNGFTLGTSTTYNNTGATYVGWQWQAGQGTTSSNTNGSITSTVSVNATAGFSIVTWNATAANATVGHGLGVAPKMIITKNRTRAGYDWTTYHESLGNTKAVWLNLTNAAGTNIAYWNNTSPTSSVFSTGIGFNLATDAYVAYCFAEIAGFSKFGSYTGNGSADGPFVFTNFQPKYIMIKRSSNVADWFVYDTVRNTYNVMGAEIYPNSSSAEGSDPAIDALSNGFKLRNSKASLNGSGDTYIYACFATNPFAQSNAR